MLVGIYTFEDPKMTGKWICYAILVFALRVLIILSWVGVMMKIIVLVV